MYFLVKSTILMNPYMSYRTEEFEDERLVRASSKEEASTKYRKYWEIRSDEYGTKYHPINVEAIPPIE